MQILDLLTCKGILGEDTFVAANVLNLQNQQVEKIFKSEWRVLQKDRHRNLIKTITSCSSNNFKGLVFLSYPDINDVDACELRLERIVNIATDVAHAVEYLRYDSSVQVLLCNIKPSNILLDEDMMAHVTDFGIARYRCSIHRFSFFNPSTQCPVVP
ncbi:hypothetical protein SUGI_0697500 [Cryptomeria japonica]|nr:hypothetical protein SUGI_0697500 [Cryptomeria japonica]